MLLAAQILTGAVALLHLWFLILEMFLWQKPIGMKTFRQNVETAKTTAVLAANQGLYNGFLAAGLVTSFVIGNAETAFAFRCFFLGCVVVAGIFGALSVSRRIFLVQALPALTALALSLLAFR
ncbi:MAG: DUF1304 domain-containing protein [Bdellovibrionota bacterium]